MGWTTSQSWRTRHDVIEHRTQNSIWYPDNGKHQRRHTCLAHCVRGNILWTVWETVNIDLLTSNFCKFRYIGCDLIQNFGKEEGHGYKDMCESMGPYYYNCPLSYLKMVPEVANQEWRDAVIKYWAVRHMKLTPGMLVGTSANLFPVVKVIKSGRRPIVEVRSGKQYTVSRSYLTGEVFETWPETA